MKDFLSNKIFIATLVAVAAVGLFIFSSHTQQIDFSTQVKPILNKKCISCHGGVKKQAGFSVLFREDMFAPTKSGKRAVIPGDPDHSEMIRRIQLTDPEERMPYKHEPLSKDEIHILKTWIKQGAQWGDHWAYVPVKETPVPAVENPWIKNDVDRFIFEKLEKEKLQPSPEAYKPTLLRRVSLDLIGTLPSQVMVDRYLNNNDADAYEILVDSLLASERFGEKWASMWLDLARYADTKGYESDNGRSIWQYRDWLIRAFNSDMPYDRFIAEQIAGDLLPDPTDAQYIATAYHRNTMTNDEGGTNNEEFRTAAVLDRVNTTWTSLMGTTFNCVQCHSHPYDPFKHDEYYKFMAYFNNARDEDVVNEYPVLREFNDSIQTEVNAVLDWVKKAAPSQVAEKKLLLKTWQPAIYAETADSLVNAVIINKNWSLYLKNNASFRLQHVDLENCDQLIIRYVSGKKGGSMQLRLDKPDGPVLASWKVATTLQNVNVPVNFAKQTGVHDVYLSYQNTQFTGALDYSIGFDWFAFTRQLPGKDLAGYDAMDKKYFALLNADLKGTPVMIENPVSMHRTSNVFERGAWTSKGKAVEPAVPQSLSFAMPANAPKNRLGLAMWLTDKRNPLVSRTIVNRLWEQLFGAGIVETLEDMGTQGISPTHKELLDHLAWQFMNDDKWQIKTLLKELVMSATYRQQSILTDELKEKDPANKLYARGPRIRLSAEQLRDQCLSISGMMSPKMYGESVMPWQPDGIWSSPYNSARWESSKGEDQYRRAVYTYWKRSSPYPSAITFDAPQKVVCDARRIRTNTPLQALATMNDSVYVDLARHFAYRMQSEAGSDVQAQIKKGYQIMLYKPMPANKLKVFQNLYDRSLALYKNDKTRTCELIGEEGAHTNAETAALIVVANAMLNLDEVVMKN